MTISQPAELGTCPACRQQLTATATYTMEQPELPPLTAELEKPNVAPSLTARLTLTGLQIRHDCRPTATRGGSIT
jgi:hypothetical protein